MSEIDNQSNRQIKLSTFWLSERLFGVDILDVKEINSETTFTPIFHSPGEIKGYVNIRGQIYLILNLHAMMGFEEEASKSSKKLIIFKQEVGEYFGVLVDKIGEVIEVYEKDIEKENYSELKDKSQINVLKQLTSGVCKLKNELLIILDANNLLKSIVIK